MGSGTVGVAIVLEGFDELAVENTVGVGMLGFDILLLRNVIKEVLCYKNDPLNLTIISVCQYVELIP
jgi:hypothetical protein